MANGYDVYIDGMLLPIAPPSIDIKVGSANKTVELINDGEINILKSPSLSEISFEARFPMRNYPYSKQVRYFDTYFDKFKNLKVNKTPFQLIISRTTPNGTLLWDTNETVGLEDFTIKEDANEGDDALIEFNFKQYKNYGTKVAKIIEDKVIPPVEKPPITKENNVPESKTYTVKSGDTLWGLAQKFYESGTQWGKLYNANKDIIESTAKRHGKASSSNGHWIFPATKLTIPT